MGVILGAIGFFKAGGFFEVTEKEDRDIVVRRAYEKIQELLDLLCISEWVGL